MFTASGVKELGDSGESWINWWLFPVDADIERFLEDHPHHNGCPGGLFAHSPTVKRSPSRVLVRQYCGYDV